MESTLFSIPLIATIAVLAVIVIGVIAFLISRYRKCASDQILVVFGNASKKVEMEVPVISEDPETGEITTTTEKKIVVLPSKVIHGGGTFVWPFIQSFKYMSLAPMQIQVTIDGRSKENIPVHIPITLTTSIGTTDFLMQNAATRVLSLDRTIQEDLLKDILIGEVRNLIATLTVIELKENRNKFIGNAKKQIDPELNKLGFEITNLNSADVKDDAKILENMSQKAATAASATADADIAEQKKLGEVSVKNTEKEKAIAISQAEMEQKTKVAENVKTQATRVAQITKEQETTLANTRSEQATQLAEIEKDKQTRIANLDAEQQTNIAKAEAIKIAAVAEQEAIANSKQSEQENIARVNIAQFNAEADAKEEEAKANKQIRIAKAEAHKEAESQKANQEKEALNAEYEANKRERQAVADQKAQVKKQEAEAAIAMAEGEANKAKQESIQKAKTAEVVAKMSVEQEQQERQLVVNIAEANAKAAKLNADQIVPAEAQKKVAEIHAEQQKTVAIVNAEAKAQSAIKEAEGDAKAILVKAEADAKAIELRGKAEAAAIKAKLEAEYKTEVEKAEGLSKAEVAGIVQLANDLGDPQAAVQFFMKDVTKDVEVAKAYAGSLREVMGSVTVYGDAATANNFASGLLSLVPQIKQMGQALGETVKTAKDAFKEKTLDEPKGESKEFSDPK